MTVEAGSAEPGKVLAAAQDSGIVKSAQELARITHGFSRIRRNRARAKHTLRFIESQVDARREVGVECERTKLLADQPPVFAKQI
jgi:hypothetical protein